MATYSDDFSGMTVGNYTLGACTDMRKSLYHARMRLARSGFASCDVIVKCFSLAPVAQYHAMLSEVQQELARLQDIRHQHIVSPLASDLYNGTLYVIFPYYEGVIDLFDSLAMLPFERRLDLMRSYIQDIAATLDYLHAEGVVHQHIYRNNLQLSAQGQLLLTGLDETLATTIESINTRYRRGTHVAPEMLPPVPDQRVDIYAFGIFIHQLFSEDATFRLDHHQPLPVIYLYNSYPLAAIHAVLSKATASNSLDRYLTAGMLYQNLTMAIDRDGPALQDAASVAAAASAASVRASGTRRRHLSFSGCFIAAILIIMLLFVGTAALHMVTASSRTAHTPTVPETVIPTSNSVMPPSTAIPSSEAQARSVVLQYYDDINTAHYQAAYDLLDPTYQQTHPYAAFAQGYANTIADTISFQSVTETTSDTFAMVLTIQAKEQGRQDLTQYTWSGTVHLVNGVWDIVPQNQVRS